MRIREERFDLNGKEVVLRNARQDEAQMLLDYLKTVSGETRFLMCDPDEIHFTIEQEENFIKSHICRKLFISGQNRETQVSPSGGYGDRSLSEVHRTGAGEAYAEKAD